jgi:hypothetical protein
MLEVGVLLLLKEKCEFRLLPSLAAAVGLLASFSLVCGSLSCILFDSWQNLLQRPGFGTCSSYHFFPH